MCQNIEPCMLITLNTTVKKQAGEEITGFAHNNPRAAKERVCRVTAATNYSYQVRTNPILTDSRRHLERLAPIACFVWRYDKGGRGGGNGKDSHTEWLCVPT